MTPGAVILARGLGTRMRKAPPPAWRGYGSESGVLPGIGAPSRVAMGQEIAASEGAKGMIPFAAGGAGNGRPFLDWVLSGLADAGITRVCLVVAPGKGALRDWYTGPGRPRRVTVEFAEQQKPLGTADAVLAAEAFAGDHPFLALNADNLYPRAALEALGRLHGAGLAGFRRSTLVTGGNIPADRIRSFAHLEVDGKGNLTRIVEKPTDAEAASFGADPLVSMNLWRFTPAIFDSCRVITPSPRGELELQDAVRHSIEYLDEHYRVVEVAEGVLDLSERGDIPAVAARLEGIEPRP